MVFKKLYEKILNSSNSFKFYKNQYKKLKSENIHMWDDIRHKDKVIKDKDDLINLKNTQIQQKDEQINHKNSVLDDKNNQIIQLEKNLEHFKTENIGEKETFAFENNTTMIYEK